MRPCSSGSARRRRTPAVSSSSVSSSARSVSRRRVVGEQHLGPLLPDQLVEAVLLPVLVVVVDPKAREVRIVVHDLDEVVVGELTEAQPRGQVDLPALVGRVRRGIQLFETALVVPLRVVGHIEDDVQALGLGRRDGLGQEVPLGRRAARDLRGPGAGVAEPAVERGQHQVVRVQLAGLGHPVVGVPAAGGDRRLPGGAVQVLRDGAHAPVQEEAGRRGAHPLLPGVEQLLGKVDRVALRGAVGSCRCGRGALHGGRPGQRTGQGCGAGECAGRLEDGASGCHCFVTRSLGVVGWSGGLKWAGEGLVGGRRRVAVAGFRLSGGP